MGKIINPTYPPDFASTVIYSGVCKIILMGKNLFQEIWFSPLFQYKIEGIVKKLYSKIK